MFEAILYIVAILLVLGFFGEPRHTTTEETTAPATTEPTAEPIEPADPVNAEPADLSALSVAELRRRATRARFPWRNHHGPNRHASKAELIAALS